MAALIATSVVLSFGFCVDWAQRRCEQWAQVRDSEL